MEFKFLVQRIEFSPHRTIVIHADCLAEAEERCEQEAADMNWNAVGAEYEIDLMTIDGEIPQEDCENEEGG